MRRASLICALAALLLATALAAPADARAPRGFFGMNSNSALDASDFDRMAAGRVGTYRLSLRWPSVQRGGSGPYDWSEADELIAQARLNEIAVQVTLYGTPPELTASGDDREAPVRSKAARSGWRKFVKAAVNRYGHGGSFWTSSRAVDSGAGAGPVSHWQVWNEQNSPTYYKPKPSVRRYAKLLRLSEGAIDAADPRAKVMLGGMFATPPRRKAIYSWRFLNRLYEIEGMKRRFDAVALHPYSPNLFGIKAQMRLARKAMRRGGDRRTPAWVTEIGWATEGSGSRLIKSRKGQARMLSKSFRLFVRKRREWDLKRVLWFSWRDNPNHGSPCTWCGAAGLLEADGDPKPSWRKFKQLTGAA